MDTRYLAPFSKATFFYVDAVSCEQHSESVINVLFDDALRVPAEEKSVSPKELIQYSIIRPAFDRNDNESVNKLLCICAGVESCDDLSINHNNSPDTMGMIVNAKSLVEARKGIVSRTYQYFKYEPYQILSEAYNDVMYFKLWLQNMFNYEHCSLFVVGRERLTSTEKAVLDEGLNELHVSPTDIVFIDGWQDSTQQYHLNESTKADFTRFIENQLARHNPREQCLFNSIERGFLKLC